MVPSVSVIIPTYKHRQYVTQAVESVLAQTYKNFEIIVVDDGSTDGTQDILAPFLDRIHYIYQSNQGLSAARNTGIHSSQGQYIAFLDADDLWLPEKLSLQVEKLDSNPEIGLVYSNMQYLNNSKILPKTAFEINPPQKGKVFNKLFKWNFITMPTVVVRRSSFFERVWFNTSLTSCEDYDAWLRFSIDHTFDYIDQPLAIYRTGSGHMSSNRIRMQENIIKIKEAVLSAPNSSQPILSESEIDRGYYRQLLKLAFYYLGVKNKLKAAELLSRYRVSQPATRRYLIVKILSFLPGGLSGILINYYLNSREKPEYALL